MANRIDEVDLDAHAARIRRQDRVATGILTAIVAFVLAFLAAIVAFIVFQSVLAVPVIPASLWYIRK